ncbi:MAG: hypothetical protein NTX52_13025, partial [Planctomycetota bacterium]|nr:hypothetical protein [Planctomycetota bacterium]
QAEPHYYDFILGVREEPIPQHIVHHIEQCPKCQEQLNRLRAALSQVDNVTPERSQVNVAVATILKLHFAYIGRPVTCQVVRPFLPTLLEPVLAVRIPTPITAHIDNCYQCSEDLETIRTLNLNRNQLSRLSQLFAERPSKGKVTCSQAHAAILFVVLMTLRETDADVLKHLCTCPDCSKALYGYRQAVCKEVEGGPEQQKFPCEKISAADIFDYVVPYGLDPAKNQYARFRESLCSHVRRCPACLGKMQQLHDTVYAILDRADSEVATVYNIDDSAKGRAFSESNDLYNGFPIKVEVLNWKDAAKAKESASTIDSTVTLKHRPLSMNLKSLAKVGFAAAAVILIALALFLNIPTARAVSIEQIYKALEKATNVYIASFVSDRKEAIQERWISRKLNIYMSKTEKQLVLWDIPNGVRRDKNLDTGEAQTTELTDYVIANIEKTIAGSLGLIPFTDLSLIPKDAKWSRVTDDNLETVDEDIEVHDLTWLEKAYDGSNVFRKWRVFVDVKMNLPQRVEWYTKLVTDNDYILRSSNEVEYLSDSRMQEVIKEASF